MPFEVLLLPLRLPQRALSALADVAATMDRRAGEIVQAIVALQAPLESVDAKVTGLEESLNGRIDEIEVKLLVMIPLLKQMVGELEDTTKLLPDPGDGPLARLKHTLTSS